MKPKNLLTIEGVIYHLNQFTQYKRHNLVWGELNKHLSFSNQNLSMAMFVACKDGKALEIPVNNKGFLESDEQFVIRERQYHEAKKVVIFDGFKKIEESTVESEHWQITFSDRRIFLDRNVGDSQFVGEIVNEPTIKKLAEKTVSNPIALKVSKDEE